MKEKKDIPDVLLPEGEWFTPGQFPRGDQMKILALTLDEPIGSYKSDFSCLGGWKGVCDGQAQNCILRSLCYFCRKNCPAAAFSALLREIDDDGPASYQKDLWKHNFYAFWTFIVVNIILWKWVILFYDKENDPQATSFARFLSRQKEGSQLLNLHHLAYRLQKEPVKINLGERQRWHREEHLLYLTIDKNFVFGVEGGESKKTHEEQQLHSHNIVSFLMAMRNFKFRIQEDQLTEHSINWFFLMDTDSQQSWNCGTFVEIRRIPSKLLPYERNHPLGPALRYFRNHMTTQAVHLTTLCFHASEGFLGERPQEKFSFECLDRVYQLEKLAREGRTFWDSWQSSLGVHIGKVLLGLIHYAPRRRQFPIDSAAWFKLLEPHKKTFWNFLFFLKTNGEEKKALELIGHQLEFLERQGYVSDGRIQKRPELPSHTYAGLKDGLKSLAKAVFN